MVGEKNSFPGISIAPSENVWTTIPDKELKQTLCKGGAA
jgi:hypothetical protein